MAKDNNNFKFELDPSVDEVIDESSESFVALRKISWNSRPAKLDIRRWYITGEGEKMGKGCSISDDSASRLVSALMQHGFGDTEEVIDSIKDRDDFNLSMRRSLTDKQLDAIKKTTKVPEEMLEPEYYDPRTIFVKDSDIKVEDD